jgi:hypothetical protein
VNTPTLTTPRLFLRPVALADASAIQEHFANWNVIKHIGGNVPWPYPADGAETFLKEDALPRVASAVDLKFLPNLRRVRAGTSNPKTALES